MKLVKRVLCLGSALVLALGSSTIAFAADNKNADPANIASDILKLDKLKEVSGTVTGSVAQSSANLVLNNKTGNATVDSWKAYIQNKTMNQDELNAFNWSFIVSQFAVPFRDNIVDVLQKSTVFRSMAEQDLVVSTNPYKDSKLGDEGLANAKIAGNQVTIKSTEFKKIYDTIVANVNYNPVVMSTGTSYKQMLVSDLWNDDGPSVAYIEDKKVGCGSGDSFSKSEMDTNINVMSSLSSIKAKQSDKNFVGKLKTIDSFQPIWVRSDITRFYTVGLVATFIKYNGALGTDDKARVAAGGVANCGNSSDFIKLYGNNPIFMDNYGNMCMLDQSKYRIIYPNYANTIFSADPSKLEGSVTVAATPEGLSNYGVRNVHVYFSDVSGSKKTDLNLYPGVNYYSQNKALLDARSLEQSNIPVSQMWDNESLFEYNKLLHTIYSRVLPQFNTTTEKNPVTNIQSSEDYYAKFLGTKASEMQNYRNNLVFLKAPAVSIWNYFGIDKTYLDTYKKTGNILVRSKVLGDNANLEQGIGTWWSPWQRIFCSFRNVAYTGPLSTWPFAANTDNVYFMGLNEWGVGSKPKETVSSDPKGYYAARALELGATTLGTYSYSGSYIVNNRLAGSAPDSFSTKYAAGITFLPLPSWALDYGQSWDIWNDKDNAYKYDPGASYSNRGMLNATIYYGTAGGTTGGGSGGDFRSNSYRYDSIIFNPSDTRISDKWVDYPKDDVAIVSFVWLNYYLNQLQYNKQFNSLKGSSYNYLKDGNDIYNEQKVLLPYETLKDDGSSPTAATLYFTNSMVNATNSASEMQKDMKSYEAYRNQTIRFNYHDLILAIAKNTNYDKNLTVQVTDEKVDAKPVDILNSINSFFTNPVTSLSNILSGFFQLVHNGIAVGNAGNIFNTTWIVRDGIMKQITVYYFMSVGIFITITLVATAFKFLHSKEAGIGIIPKDFLWAVVLSVLPMLVLNSVSVGINSMSQGMLSNDGNKMALIDMEKEIRGKLNLNANFEAQYQPFREQFKNVSDTYKDLGIEQATMYDKYKQTLVYKDVTIKDLCDNVSYERIMGTVSDDSGKSATAQTMDGVGTDTDKPKDKNNTPLTWYNKSGFMPVHYSQYKDNIFYYFYDYIRYQYLKYYSNIQATSAVNDIGNDKLTGISSLATQYTTTDLVSDMTDTDKKTIFGLEKQFLTTCVGGTAYMYNDRSYAYGASYGGTKYRGTYVQDMFGLGYLFDVTNNGQVKVSDTEMLSSWQKDAAIKYTPLASVMQSPYWDMYKRLNILAENEKATHGTVSRLPFSPFSMREANAKDTLYRGRGNDSRNADTKVYASRTGLYEAFKYTDGIKGINITPFENQLMNLNNKMYLDALDILKYKPNEIRDSTMITAIALACTFEFNRTFKPDGLTSEVKPNTFTEDSMDLDKTMRIMFAKDMNSIENNTEVMYMILSQNLGLFTALFLALAEIALVLAVMMRMMLFMSMFALLCAFVVLFSVGRGRYRKQILLGVVGQTVVMFLCQFAILTTINIATTSLNGTAEGGWSLPVAIILFIVFVGVSIVSFSMLKIMISDWKTLGGATIAGAIDGAANSVRSRINRQHMSANNFAGNFRKYARKDSRDIARIARNKDKASKVVDNIKNSENTNSNTEPKADTSETSNSSQHNTQPYTQNTSKPKANTVKVSPRTGQRKTESVINSVTRHKSVGVGSAPQHISRMNSQKSPSTHSRSKAAPIKVGKTVQVRVKAKDK